VDHRRSPWSVEDDQFEEVAGSVWPEYEVAERIVTDLLHGESTGHRVLDVLVDNAMAVRRRENLHTGVS
jgi:hypothetical protein